MKQIIITILAFILLAGLILFINKKPTLETDNTLEKSYSFITNDNRTGIIIYYNHNYENATLEIDGEQYLLYQDEISSGMKYSSSDKRVVYVESRGNITIEIDGVITTATIAIKNQKINDDCKEVDQNCDRINDLSIEDIHIDALTMYRWQWKETRDGRGGVTVPKESTQFIAQFSTDGKFSSTTDCNNIFGTYTSGDESLTIEELGSTKKACINESQENSYISMIQVSEGYIINTEGELVLTLEPENTTMVFIPVTKNQITDNLVPIESTIEKENLQ